MEELAGVQKAIRMGIQTPPESKPLNKVSVGNYNPCCLSVAPISRQVQDSEEF
jgi:hypothetical protein